MVDINDMTAQWRRGAGSIFGAVAKIGALQRYIWRFMVLRGLRIYGQTYGVW